MRKGKRMRIKVHDVGHGFCLSLVHENGNVMLWDCGHTSYNRPSTFLPQEGIHKIDRFFVTNYDEDHISDIQNLRNYLLISTLHRNPSISADELRRLKMKSGPISSAMESLLNMIGTYIFEPPNPEPDFPRVEFGSYYNEYPSDFSDTNNISLVTFLDCCGLKFVIPGDIEKAGWEKLLENSSFQEDLSSVNIFIASHHGRENGYCRTVFDYCRPGVVIFSDSYIKYATQEMANTYRSHASGINFNGETRYVLSTRNDGSFWWDI